MLKKTSKRRCRVKNKKKKRKVNSALVPFYGGSTAWNLIVTTSTMEQLFLNLILEFFTEKYSPAM